MSEINNNKTPTIQKKHWISLTILGILGIIAFTAFNDAIRFNNQMINLNELKAAELETTKVEYGQCIVKILETNQIAKAYREDVMTLANKAGSNLKDFNNKLVALIGTQVIPGLSSNLRETVQHEIISCRNAYTARVDLNLKPMFVNFNRLQKEFPNNIYNKFFYHWQPENLNMPTNETAEKTFATGKITSLDLQ